MYHLTRWFPRDRSGKVCWLLNELEVPFEVQTLDHSKDHDCTEYRKIHPLGSVPALRIPSLKLNLFESGAICLYLAESHPEKDLMPTELKALCYQWVMYNYATLEPVIIKYWEIDSEEPNAEEKKSEIDKIIIKLLAPIESILIENKYICGEKFTVADIPLSQSIFWLRNRPFIGVFPNTFAYFERQKNRKAAREAELFIK